MRWLALALLSLSVSKGQPPEADMPKPESVIVCERGGVQKDISHIASVSICVLKDSSGGSTSAGAISIYSDDGAIP